MAISTRRSRTPTTAAAAAARRQSAAPSVASTTAAATAESMTRRDNDAQQGEHQQQGRGVDEEMMPATGTSTSSSSDSSSGTTQTPPVSSSTGGSVDVPASVSEGSVDVVRRSGPNKRLKVVHAAPHGEEVTVEQHEQEKRDTSSGVGQDEDMRDDGGHSGSNGGDTTTAEWTEDTDTQQEILARIADLSSKNQKLNADIELLKRNFTLRQAETNRLLVGMSALNKVETDLGLLQREYRDCARNNVALIQDALRRISYCSSQVDTLTSGGNVTATQLQNFQHECSREMDDLLLKLEDVEAGQQSQQDQVDSNNLSTLGEIRRNRYEIEQLKQEISACKRFMSGSSGVGEASMPRGGGAPVQQQPASVTTKVSSTTGTGSDTLLLSRIEYFSSQLEDLHNEMAMLKQFLLQECNASRSGIEKLLARQMNDFQEVQDDETKRLQDEMDELRSELCDVLKEMHLLKERTRYLRPDCSLKARKRSREESSKNRRQLQQQAGNRYVNAGGGSPEICSTCSSFLGGGGYSSLPSTHCSRTHCDHPYHCRYHYPVAVAGRMDQGGEYAYPSDTNVNMSPTHHHSPSSSRSSSPRRPSDVVIQALQQQHGGATAQENQSCPSPHFSSRSSSISGRISMNRGMHRAKLSWEIVKNVKSGGVNDVELCTLAVDENGEPLPEEEVERRLLEQHRLFWIKEGAGEAK